MPHDRDRERDVRDRSGIDDRDHYSRNHRDRRGDEDEYSRKDRQLTRGSRRSRSRSHSRSRSKSPRDRSPADGQSSGNKYNNRTTTNTSSSSSSGIQMKLMSTVPPKPVANKPTGIKKLSVAAVFNDDDDDEPEEMPAECRMRMKNVGRETPTSAGPNSFGKTKIGFCNRNVT